MFLCANSKETAHKQVASRLIAYLPDFFIYLFIMIRLCVQRNLSLKKSSETIEVWLGRIGSGWLGLGGPGRVSGLGLAGFRAESSLLGLGLLREW